MTTAMVILAFLLALYYPLALMARSDWKGNQAIVGQFVFSWIIVLVLSLGVYRELVHAPPEWARQVAFGLTIVGLAVQDILMTRVQNRRSTRIARERREGIERLKEERSDTPG